MNNREANRADHPPYCTCVRCTNHRLAGKDGGSVTPNQDDYYKGGTYWGRLLAVIVAVSLISVVIWGALIK